MFVSLFLNNTCKVESLYLNAHNATAPLEYLTLKEEFSYKSEKNHHSHHETILYLNFKSHF